MSPQQVTHERDMSKTKGAAYGCLAQPTLNVWPVSNFYPERGSPLFQRIDRRGDMSLRYSRRHGPKK